MMNDDIKKVSVSEAEIKHIVEKLGTQISKDFKDRNPLFIGLLKGCIPFMSDLLKYVDIDCTLEYMKVSSYSGTESTGIVTVKGGLPDVLGREVILIDDILYTGRTLANVRKMLMDAGAKSVTICVLLDKPEGRKVDITPAYVGGLVPNEFVVGYGLDYNEHYRNLPYIGVLKEEVYSK